MFLIVTGGMRCHGWNNDSSLEHRFRNIEYDVLSWQVRELQRVTGASIDVPPSSAKDEDGSGDQKRNQDEEVLVTIEGPFFAIQVGNRGCDVPLWTNVHIFRDSVFFWGGVFASAILSTFHSRQIMTFAEYSLSRFSVSLPSSRFVNYAMTSWRDRRCKTTTGTWEATEWVVEEEEEEEEEDRMAVAATMGPWTSRNDSPALSGK